MKPCPVCGSPVLDLRRIHCSRKCRHLGEFPPRPCEICGVPHRNAKYCSPPCRHLGRRRRETRVCPGCGKNFEARPGDPTVSCSLACAGLARTGPNNVRYNSGFSKTPDGRTIVCTRDGRYVFWYRIVMEDIVGRPLRSDEIVHHINGDHTDDRPENLEVLTRAEHINAHRAELAAAAVKAATKPNTHVTGARAA